MTDFILKSLQRVEIQRLWSAARGGVAKREDLGGGRGLLSNGRGLRRLDKVVGGGVSCVNDKKLHYQRAHPLQRSMAPASRWDILRPGGVPFAALMRGLAKQSP